MTKSRQRQESLAISSLDDTKIVQGRLHWTTTKNGRLHRPFNGWTNIQHLENLTCWGSWSPVAVSSRWGSYLRTHWLPRTLEEVIKEITAPMSLYKGPV